MQRISSEERKNIRILIADILNDISDLERTKLEWAGNVPEVARSYD